MDLALELVERRLVPDAIVRVGIRRLLRRKLAEEHRGGAAAQQARREAVLERMRSSDIALQTEDANRQHYGLPPAFFETVLGPWLKYSCALWSPGVQSLAASEEAMLALTADRAGLADGQRILELGCGWGSLSLWMAERYPRARIVAVSNASEQRRFIESRAAARGLANLRVVTADMNDFSPEGDQDRIVSVEMFEHMRNWPRLLDRIAGWLAPGGALFLHVFCHREFAYFFETDGGSDWMARHFFTGGLMPSRDLVWACANRLRVDAQWDVGGAHYGRTCRAWLARMDAAPERLLPLFERIYGPREARRWFARWRMFFLACSEMFDYADGTEWFVRHARLVRKEGE